MRKAICALCAILLLLPFAAGAEIYSFPYLGTRLQAPEGWTVLLKDDLDAQQAWIERTGADIEAIRADYAANHTVFEVFMQNGAQVSLSVSETAETAAWDSVERMTRAEADAYMAGYAHPPYQNVEWSKEAPGFIRYHWAMEAGGAEVSFARLSTIWQGALYTLTATGVDVSTEALQAANFTVLTALDFIGVRVAAPLGKYAPPPPLPEPILDDGRVTPMSLVEFTGITDQDQTAIFVETLPGAELLLQTQSDMLRNTANAEGRQKFTLSTRRETTYVYTLTATAAGRSTSTLNITVERRLSAEALEGSYKRGAMAMDAWKYAQIMASLEEYRDRAVTFRGRVAEISEANGFPCALFYISNPTAGEWRDPLWVVLMQPYEIAVNEVLSVWGDLRGDALPYQEGGAVLSAPAVIGRLFSK